MSRFLIEYAPKSINDVVFNNQTLLPMFQAVANGVSTNNLMLYGPVGTGKTAIAKLVTELYYTNRGDDDLTMFVDLTQTTDFNVVRSAMSRNTIGFSNRWWFILDEGDKAPSGKSIQLLNELHNMIGKYSYCSFIITTNSLGHMPAGIQSRCYPIKIEPPTPQQFLDRARQIVAAEGKSATDAEIIAWLSIGNNDIRHYLTGLEMNLASRPKTLPTQPPVAPAQQAAQSTP